MAAPRSHGLSKSRYCSGLQCHRQLWWRTHEPDAPELVPDTAQQAIFDEGTRVGELARSYVPGGVLVDRPHNDFAGRLADTRAALASGAPAIYEAAFSAGRVFAAVDILLREGEGWRVIEVKSSTRVKPQHVPDAAVQVWVLRQAGLTVTGADVMVLNRECTHPDLSDLFRRENVTREVEDMLTQVPGEVRRQLAMLAGPLPEVPVGPHCDSPYPCPFKPRCFAGQPEHHVRTLYNSWREVPWLIEQGYLTIGELPPGLGLNALAERQRRAVREGRLVVEGDLARALARFEPPLAHLDFETVAPAVPVWPGCRPYDAVAVQFSCHREGPDGGLEHHAWVAEGDGDPRRAIAERVVEACRGARAVVAYHASYEKHCLEMLAAAAPGLAEPLHDVASRLEDLLPVVRDHVYHPAFGGGFGLKAVLPALVPELSYDGLAITDGNTASAELARLVFRGESVAAEEREGLRRALLDYCALDTLAMVRLLARLRELAREQGRARPNGGARRGRRTDSRGR